MNICELRFCVPCYLCLSNCDMRGVGCASQVKFLMFDVVIDVKVLKEI